MKNSTTNKVLFILHLPPPIHGAAMMGKYIHDSSTVNRAFDCRYINLTTAAGLEDIGKWTWRKPIAFLKLVRSIRRTVKTWCPDLVYVTPNSKGIAFYKDFLVVEMLKARGCRVILHYHNKGVQTRQNRWFDNILYKRFFKHVKVILLAEPLYQDVCKYVRREDIYICPNGIPLPTESAVKKEQPRPEILFLSNLLISKGILVLLDALAILKQQGHDFHCTIGGGVTKELSASSLQEEILARGLQENVTYKGKLMGKEKVSTIKNADLFAHPTFQDCFPIVLLEAMSHGVPCITTNEGGIPCIVEDGVTGFITEKKSPTAIAEKIDNLIQHPDIRRKMGEAGRKRFLEHFTISTFEKRLTTILKAAIESQL